MIQVTIGAQTVRVSRDVFTVKSPHIRFCEAEPNEEVDEIDVNLFSPGGLWQPMNWKEILHFKAEGEISRRVGANGVRTRRTWMSASDALVHLDAGYAEPGTVTFPIGRICSAVIGDIGIVVNSRYIESGDGKTYFRYRMAYYTVKKVGGFWWYASSSTSTKFPPHPTEKYGSREGALAACFAWAYDGVYDLDTLPTSSSRLSTTYSPGTTGRIVPVSELYPHLIHERNMFMRSANEWDVNNSPALHATAFDSIQKFDGNMLAFISELPTFGTTGINSIIELMRSAPSKASVASFWLSNRYGDRLSFRDAYELFQGIDRTFLDVHTTRYLMGKSRNFATYTDGYFPSVSMSQAVQVAVSPKDTNGLMRAIRHAYEWDYYPSLGNVWDMIPLSFVVDWFVNISDIFESADRLVQARYYDVHRILQSIKAEGHSPLFPEVTYTYYNRYLRSSLLLGVDSVQLGLPSAINILDGIALLAM